MAKTAGRFDKKEEFRNQDIVTKEKAEAAKKARADRKNIIKQKKVERFEKYKHAKQARKSALEAAFKLVEHEPDWDNKLKAILERKNTGLQR